MRFYRWLLLLVLLSAAGVATAQDTKLDKTFTFDGGAVFSYPSDWTLDSDPKYLVDIHSDITTIYFEDFSNLKDQGLDKNSALTDAAQTYFNAFYSKLRFKASDVKDIKVGDREAIRYDYTTPDKQAAFIIVVRMSDGTFGLLEAVTSDSAFSEEDIVLAVANSFDLAGSDAGSGTGSGTAAPSTTVSCTVSTDVANTVHIRVGPGNNRTAFAFLPAETEFEVLGQATVSKNVWYKLDKETVAPGKSAAEAWVAAKDVVATGNCDAVVDVNAPPVIPIVSAPPPSTGGGDTGGGQVTGGAVPSSGSWTITYAAYAPGSCLNTGTVNIPVDFAPEHVSLSVSGGGSSIIFGGSSFNRIQPGEYQGLYTDPDGISELTTLRVASSTLMSIEYIDTGTVQGTTCSITVNGTVTHN